MTNQDPLIQALAHVTFYPGTASKRFVRDILSSSPDYELTVRQVAFAQRIAWIFRRQMPVPIIDSIKGDLVFHQFQTGNPQCMRCLQQVSKRELNRPCAGPPQPRSKKKKAISEQISLDSAK